MTDSGGFPPGTPVSTHLLRYYIKERKKEIKRDKKKIYKRIKNRENNDNEKGLILKCNATLKEIQNHFIFSLFLKHCAIWWT